MTSWIIPVSALTGIVDSETIVYGTIIDLDEVRANHAIQVNVSDYTGDGTIQAVLSGSLDGENWYRLTSVPNGITANGVFFATVEDTSVPDTAPGYPAPARYLQAWANVFSGSGSATVTIIATSS